MQPINCMKLEIPSKSANEALARITVAAFASQLDPTVSEITEIKTAVSEAVTNSIIHGYKDGEGIIDVYCELYSDRIEIEIEDTGVGIEDILLARQPMYTSKPDLDRAGMGFCVMESFMDKLFIDSEVNRGTKIKMVKQIKK